MTLQQTQQAQSAVFDDDAGRVPLHFGDPAAEYAAAREDVVLVDRSDRGRVHLAGADRLAILHRISTNAVQDLRSGEGQATVLTTPIGRVIDRVILHNDGADHTLLQTSRGRGQQVTDTLRRNVFFRDKMTVDDVSASTVQFMLYGPRAADVAAALLSGAEALAVHHVLAGIVAGANAQIFAADDLGLPGFGVVTESAQGTALWNSLVAAGCRPAGTTTADLLRIEAGRPGSVELAGDFIPLEVGLWDDVSFSKGCYTGQEIIARMESRGQLARMLVRVALSDATPPGTPLLDGDREQGQLTSVALHPVDGWIGLGVVRSALAVVGQELRTPDGQTATVRWVQGVPAAG